jgi:hypothetical protein
MCGGLVELGTSTTEAVGADAAGVETPLTFVARTVEATV